MNLWTSKEFRDLLKKLVDQQYNDFEEIDEFDDLYQGWIPAEPEIKAKIKPIPGGLIDLTSIKKDKMKDLIKMAGSIRIYDFYIKMSEIEYIEKDRSDLTACLSFYEEKHKTPNGMPCKMQYALNLRKDARFSQCPWRANARSSLSDVSIDQIVDIVRWFQVISKLSSFA